MTPKLAIVLGCLRLAAARRGWVVFCGLVVVAQLAWWITLFAPALPERLSAAHSLEVEYRDGSPAFIFLSDDERFRIDSTQETISPLFLEALIRFEDKRFFQHPGVDPIAIGRAVLTNLQQRRVASGASTLTLQLVRVLEPRPRTVRSKLIEVVRALQIESRLSKAEILSAYLTFAPYGRNLEGVVAASWSYFGHGPEALSAAEIATLLAVPQSPTRRYPTEDNAARLKSARDRIGGWLGQQGMLEWQKIDDRAHLLTRSNRPVAGRAAADREPNQNVSSSPVPRKLRPLPRSAAHAAFWLKDEGDDQGSIPLSSRRRLETTLDRGLQATAEKLLASTRSQLKQQGIHNASIVLVEHSTREVRALVGNFDFFDGYHGGQLAGFAVPRSTGSTLKPLIYALALDQGKALPAHLVADAPIVYGDYSPDNYDGSFVGLIRLEEALALSLNIPFVRLLSQVGMAPFLETLRTMEVESMVRRDGYYGLSAAIGALEMTPLEMARFYTALANDGLDAPLRFLAGDEEAQTTPLFSVPTAHLVRQALSRRDRPDFPGRWDGGGHAALLGQLPIHWKTGTSYGHRDAWAVGSGPRFTAVVWLGNFDATSAFDLVGADAAGPILFDVLEAAEGLGQRGSASVGLATAPWPEGLSTVEVCAWSGHVANRWCPERMLTQAPQGSVASGRCPLHRELEVDVATGLSVLPGCRDNASTEKRVFRVWPDSIRRLYKERGASLPALPPMAEGCRTMPVLEQHGNRPRVVSPAANATIVLIPGLNAEEQLVPLRLAQTASRSEQTVSWFMDGEFLGRTASEETWWWQPTAGRHELFAVTGDGGEARIWFDVLGAR